MHPLNTPRSKISVEQATYTLSRIREDIFTACSHGWNSLWLVLQTMSVECYENTSSNHTPVFSCPIYSSIITTHHIVLIRTPMHGKQTQRTRHSSVLCLATWGFGFRWNTLPQHLLLDAAVTNIQCYRSRYGSIILTGQLDEGSAYQVQAGSSSYTYNTASLHLIRVFKYIPLHPQKTSNQKHFPHNLEECLDNGGPLIQIPIQKADVRKLQRYNSPYTLTFSNCFRPGEK